MEGRPFSVKKQKKRKTKERKYLEAKLPINVRLDIIHTGNPSLARYTRSDLSNHLQDHSF